MRKFIIAAVAFLMAATCSYAQPGPQPQEKGPHHQHEGHRGAPQDRKYPTQDEIRSQKIAFFTQELELTPEEAQVFWPVYNAGWKKGEQARREVHKTLKELNAALKDEAGSDDAKIQGLMDKYFKAIKAEADINAQTYAELAKVVPVSKAAKTFTLEERFRIMLIKQLRR